MKDKSLVHITSVCPQAPRFHLRRCLDRWTRPTRSWENQVLPSNFRLPPSCLRSQGWTLFLQPWGKLCLLRASQWTLLFRTAHWVACSWLISKILHGHCFLAMCSASQFRWLWWIPRVEMGKFLEFVAYADDFLPCNRQIFKKKCI